MGTTRIREDFRLQHIAGITLIKEGLTEKLANLSKIEGFTTLLGKFTEKMSDQGKAIAADLNKEALDTTEAEMKEEFRIHYDAALATASSELKQGKGPTAAVQKAQGQFKQSLEHAQIKEKLFQSFLSRLTAKRQIFNQEDTPHLRDAFNQHIDKTIEGHSDSLKDFQSLESVKARLQLNAEDLKRNSNASMTAQELKENQLNSGPKKEPAIGYNLDINNLRQQLKTTLANLKPGEKVNIEVTKPDRPEIEKTMTEDALRHRTPLLAILLLLYLQIFYFARIPFLMTSKKNDEQRVLKAIQDLAKKDGLIIDPKDINLNVKVIRRDGKEQTEFEGPLKEPFVAELNKTADEVRAQIFPINKPLQQAPKPSSHASRAKEEQEETKRPALIP